MPQALMLRSWTVLWRPTRPSRTNTKKRCYFHHRGLECKSRKSRNIWSNRKVWSWSTEWSRAKANRALPWKRTGIQTPSSNNAREDSACTSPDGQYQNYIDYIICSQRWRSSIQSAKTRSGADCGSDHELLTAKFILKLTKVGEKTRPLKYDLKSLMTIQWKWQINSSG